MIVDRLLFEKKSVGFSLCLEKGERNGTGKTEPDAGASAPVLRTKRYDTMEKDLALILDEDEMKIGLALVALEKAGLLVRGAGEYEAQMTHYPEMVGTGSESAAAQRMRNFRERKALPEIESKEETSHCDTDVTLPLHPRYGEREKEIEIDNEREGESNSGVLPRTPFGRYQNALLTNQEEAEPKGETEEPEELPPLTPEGNLTLVDDISAESRKQFITVVTKNNNYFYLIIDRDDEGNQTVHFLNQVDEEDLFNLMDDEDAKAVQEAMNEEKAQEEGTAEPQEPTKEPEKETTQPAAETVEQKQNVSLFAAAGVLIIVIGGIAIWIFLQAKKKKKPADQPDPDADYREDDDGYDIPEESEEEEAQGIKNRQPQHQCSRSQLGR